MKKLPITLDNSVPMKRNQRHSVLFTLLFLFTSLFAHADAIDSLEAVLRDKPQIQEKIYLHLDNNCYFIGDTIWYKAYVVTADNLHPTNLSRLLYVELLNSDGFVVGRQHIMVSDKGKTCGQFALTDSLYSGYYEIRAYTKWQLNFGVSHRKYSFIDERKFYNKEMCADYFREYPGLYSRVVPVYNKVADGAYDERYMDKRPKQHVLKNKRRLLASFFPEGGCNVQGVRNNIAFEVTDQDGQAVKVEGKLSDGTTFKTDHMGRGSFAYTPSDNKQKAVFKWEDKEYSFDLPQMVGQGVALHYDPLSSTATINAVGVKAAAYGLLCRGRLQQFKRLNGETSISLKNMALPTGINEIIIYDANANPLASRLFFVNNHDMGRHINVKMTDADGEIKENKVLKPHQKINLEVSSAIRHQSPNTYSIAIRDDRTDDTGYDDGNIMTDMLLSSELRGFVANPAYYFVSDDAKHITHLDQLMMIQGWHRYERVDHARYLPEVGLTFEGSVYKVPRNADMLEITDLDFMSNNNNFDGITSDVCSSSGMSELNQNGESTEVKESQIPTSEPTISDPSEMFHNQKRLKKEVLIEGEVEVNGKSYGVIARTNDGGKFTFNIPPYYNKGILFLKAYNVKDSVKRNMEGLKDKKWRDERAYPDYYVKRDMFFPVFAKPYSWYQINSPELFFKDEDDDANIPENSKLAGNHMLQTVIVRSRRRGKRSWNYDKPALVRDIYELYNDVTDYGLSPGVLNFKMFPLQATTCLFGNMGLMRTPNIRGMLERASFYRNYSNGPAEYDVNMSSAYMFERLRLSRLKEVRVYTDYELRTDSGYVAEDNVAAVILDFKPLEDDGVRYSYRDRRYEFHGITYAEQFYSPDYSSLRPLDPVDYRRTLYWNPNAVPDADGKFSVTFYNNSRQTRLHVSATGIDSNGQMYYTE